ncbi:acyltransferase [Xenorhabdus sp. PB62.4]|uniref:acyltransferase family protein n=1 Tax=Xenorhabdus sp. PB62.4 TaxID=1851573 RepID=UPI001656C5ED|nr:acyltransferase [Xenorhabdus sp. PB62.4]
MVSSGGVKLHGQHFYIIFFLSLIISHKYRGVICSTLILIIFLALQLGFNETISLNVFHDLSIPFGGITKVIISIFSSPMIVEFVLGIFCYYCLKYIRSDFLKLQEVRFILISLVSCCFVILLSESTFKGHGIHKWGFISFMLIFLFVLYERIFSIKKMKSLFFLGDISYSIYMTHIIIINFLYRDELYFNLNGIPKFIFYIFVTIIFSTLTHFFIEKPSINLCRNILRKIKRTNK